MLLRKILFVTLLTWFSLTIFGYGIYKALPIILGPKIEISSPQNGQVVNGTSISVRGTVYRTKALYINNIPTAFTESGSFETRLAIYPGSNILIIQALDKFGRSVSKTVNIGTN
jgi:hypothetical protein